MGDIILTSEQKKFLAECEEEFKDRYTEKDTNFMEIKRQVPKKPPIVDPWYNKPRRPYDWTRQNQNQNKRNHHWDRRSNERNERWERHAGKHHMHHRQRMY
ncbi:RNA guanine-N7 methyltransferase activating subunit-like [Odontomachus brunneus]|uniref:RNA guanine-N7 methyltransferase activating subunit-like n=1 Tax=Odontomachus brunneus TaxID=486640 RepID=UPI0013F23A81|nr:RNA guanine-N7 methyltransferase activating subunit-like [Odontomachus brunneus]XP_032677574.1 RNA guanine-N7 methyltransferase activating subunit-like [Odontomachus brunneus]